MKRLYYLKMLTIVMMASVLVACNSKKSATEKEKSDNTVKVVENNTIQERLKTYLNTTELWKAVFEEEVTELEYAESRIDSSRMILIVRNKNFTSNKKYVVLYGSTTDLHCEWFYSNGEPTAVGLARNGDILLCIEGSAQGHGHRDIRDLTMRVVVGSESTWLDDNLHGVTAYTWNGEVVDKSSYENKLSELLAGEWKSLAWTTYMEK